MGVSITKTFVCRALRIAVCTGINSLFLPTIPAPIEHNIERLEAVDFPSFRYLLFDHHFVSFAFDTCIIPYYNIMSVTFIQGGPAGTAGSEEAN